MPFEITEPGLYLDVPAADYHADPCPEPSLSSGVAATLLNETPLAARMRHPRLNRLLSLVDDPDEDQIMGTVCHKLTLGRGREVAVFPYDAWRSNEAKAARAGALEAGLIPLKAAQYERAIEIVDAGRAQLSEYDPEKCPGVSTIGVEGEGHAEAVVAVRDPATGVWLRIMVDWLDLERGVFWDYKTGKSSPAGAAKQIARMGYTFQLAFYTHVLESAFPELEGRILGGWVFQQTIGARELRVLRPSEGDLGIGRRQVAQAISDFSACLHANEWPSYRREIETIALPTFAHADWLDRELAEETGAGSSWAFAGGRE